MIKRSEPQLPEQPGSARWVLGTDGMLPWYVHDAVKHTCCQQGVRCLERAAVSVLAPTFPMPLHSSTHCPCRRTNNAIVHQAARVVHVSSSRRYRFSSAHVRTATALCASPNKQEGLTELESSRESDLKPVSNSQNSENDSSNSNRLILLAGLVAAAAIILYSSGGFAGLKERVQVKRHYDGLSVVYAMSSAQQVLIR